MSQVGVGVIEGFFGPEWSWESRHQFCETIAQANANFYIYAPKRDPYLRKNWMQTHPASQWQELKQLRKKCADLGIQFGLGLSPFEIHEHWDSKAKESLRAKILQLQELNSDYLGLFFDDMKGSSDLAEKQIEIVEFVRGITNTKLWFCPTYYSDDPILDKVFGQRPEKYLEKISALSTEVEILWTGSKVISKIITGEELDQVAKILKRKPLIWDNYFANDGPKQCKFLRMRPFEGRNKDSFQASSGWALNLMNQPSLSEVLFVSSAKVLMQGLEPQKAYAQTLQEMLSQSVAAAVGKNEKIFNEVGLDNLSSEQREQITFGSASHDRFAKDVADWLNGKYIVGPECLTD